MLGRLLGAAFEAFGPRIAKESVEYGVTKGVTGALGRRVANFTAGEAGQRLASRVVGQRVATRLATAEGQKLVKYAASREMGNAVRGKGDFAPDPKTKVVHAAANSTVPSSVNDPSQMNMFSADDPVVKQYQANRRVANRQPQRKGNAGATGWMGTGKGWWEQNEQVSQRGAFDPSSVTTLGKFDAARGPAKWAHPLGKGLATRNVARAVGFAEGYRSVGDGEEGPKPVPAGPQPVPMQQPKTARFSEPYGGIHDADVDQPALGTGRRSSFDMGTGNDEGALGTGVPVGGGPSPVSSGGEAQAIPALNAGGRNSSFYSQTAQTTEPVLRRSTLYGGRGPGR